MSKNLLFADKYKIDDNISVRIPTLKEVYEYGEAQYFQVSRLLTSMPYDLMVQLDDMGIDFTKISEYELFFLMLQTMIINETDLSIIFGDLDLKSLQAATHNETKEPVMIDKDYNVIIDRNKQVAIADVIRKINFWKKTNKNPGNDEGKEYLLARNRKKLKRAAKKKQQSFLDNAIIALVNTEEFKYNYKQSLDLTIYQFNASYTQIPHKKHWDEIAGGIYAGTVDSSTLNLDKLNWLSIWDDYIN